MARVLYVGLTHDPERRRREHGNPEDWYVTPAFYDEVTARLWEHHMLQHPDTTGGSVGPGWRYGYCYTITKETIQ